MFRETRIATPVSAQIVLLKLPWATASSISGIVSGSSAVLDRLHELVVNVPGKIDPLVLFEDFYAGIDNRSTSGLGVERRKIRLRQELAHDLRGAAGTNEVVNWKVTKPLNHRDTEAQRDSNRLGPNNRKPDDASFEVDC